LSARSSPTPLPASSPTQILGPISLSKPQPPVIKLEACENQHPAHSDFYMLDGSGVRGERLRRHPGNRQDRLQI
jgi:hypothetical protein